MKLDPPSAFLRVFHPLPLTAARALDFHRDGEASISLSVKEAASINQGDGFWIAEPWRTFVSLDGTDEDDVWHSRARRGAGVAYDAGGPGLSIRKRIGEERGAPDYHYGERENLTAFGRLRPAFLMPRWASRSTAVISDILLTDTHAIFGVRTIAGNVDDLIARGLVAA